MGPKDGGEPTPRKDWSLGERKKNTTLPYLVAGKEGISSGELCLQVLDLIEWPVTGFVRRINCQHKYVTTKSVDSKFFHDWHTLNRVAQQCRCPTEHWMVGLDDAHILKYFTLFTNTTSPTRKKLTVPCSKDNGKCPKTGALSKQGKNP